MATLTWPEGPEINARVIQMRCATCGAEPGDPCVVIKTGQPRLGEPTARMHITRYYAMWESIGAYDQPPTGVV